MVHQIARNTIGHSGYEVFPARRDGRPMFDFLTTTTHHDLHHATARSNYGLYFTWWDRWMGTEHADYYARFARAARSSAPVTLIDGSAEAIPIESEAYGRDAAPQ
jgi:sterol desaturase/sphingolipid hydroxylase (fatty acid hydroxylase superfamily)